MRELTFNHSQVFEHLRLAAEQPPSLDVAVPARRRQGNSTNKPLQGLRFAVKDLFNISGLRPTVGCRAYYAIAEPATTTAPTLTKLIDLGANLLGTLKLGSLITKEEPSEAADYQAPFNPRGDGYQSPWSSSSGSGAAIASYKWLDFTLGTDSKQFPRDNYHRLLTVWHSDWQQSSACSRKWLLPAQVFSRRGDTKGHHPLLFVCSPVLFMWNLRAYPRKSIAIHWPAWLTHIRPFDALSIFTRDLEMLKRVASSWIPIITKKSRNVWCHTFQSFCWRRISLERFSISKTTFHWTTPDSKPWSTTLPRISLRHSRSPSQSYRYRQCGENIAF